MNDNPDGYFQKGEDYYFGRSVSQDHREAVKWLRKAAEGGHAAAQLALGAMYAVGHGVPKDDGFAAEWTHKAAAQGLAEAQYSLAHMHIAGRGVPQDDAEASTLFRKAAEQGHKESQYELSLLYAEGRGVPQDETQALEWLRKAAEQGHEEAINQLIKLSGAGNYMRLMTLENRHLFDCSLEERMGLLGRVNEMIKLSELVRNEGFLSLEADAKTWDDKFLKSIILLICEGCPPDEVTNIFTDLIISSGKTGAELLKQLITAEGALSIQAGDNPRIIGFKLSAMLGDEVLFCEELGDCFGFL